MTENELVQRISVAVGDDFYLDRGEEQRIKEAAAGGGMSLADIERVLRRELEKTGAAHERVLLDEAERLLHQYTDKDHYLDAKEEENLYQKVTRPAAGRKKGLDPRVAREFVDNFCATQGVKRAKDVKKRRVAVVATLVFLGAAGAVGYTFATRQPSVIEKEKLVVQKVEVAANVAPLSTDEQKEVDDLLARAGKHVERSEYTDPPERSAKACLDRIRSIDPSGQYRAPDVTALVDRIVEEYLKLADKSFAGKDLEATRKWSDRARLFNKNSELIRERERKYGFVKAEK